MSHQSDCITVSLRHALAHANGTPVKVETVHESGWVNVTVAGRTFFDTGCDALARLAADWTLGVFEDTCEVPADDVLAVLEAEYADWRDTREDHRAALHW